MAKDRDRGEYRYVDVGLKDNPEFQALAPLTKLAYVWIELNLGRSGIGTIYPGAIEAQTGISTEQLERAYAELDGDGSRPFDVRRDGYVVWMVHQLAGDPTLAPDNRNHRKGVQIHVDTLPQRSCLTQAFRSRYRAWFPNSPSPPNGPGMASEGHTEPLAKPSEARDADADALAKAERSGCGGSHAQPSLRLEPLRSAPLSAHAEPRTAPSRAAPAAEHVNASKDRVYLGVKLLPESSSAAQRALFSASSEGSEPDQPPPLPIEAEQLLARFYQPGTAKYDDARGQLLAVIRLEHGAKIDRQHGWVKGTSEQLAAACRELLAEPPRDQQLAARFVLLRLQSRQATVRPTPPPLAEPDPAEAAARDAYGEELATALAGWRLEHTGELRELEEACTRQFAGTPASEWFRQAWIDSEIMKRQACPGFEAWYRERQRSIRAPAPAKAAAREFTT